MARVALIDGDSFAYRCAAAVEKTKYLVRMPDGTFPEFATHKEAVAAASDGGVIWSRKTVGTLKEAADILEHAMERSISRAQAGVFHVFLGGSGPTFRDHLGRLRKYKGNREGVERPKYLGDLRDYLVRYWGGQLSSGEEADDVLCYTATELRESNTTIIIGNDKDLNQISGEHYDWVRDEKYTITDAQARHRLWVQVLSGDVADNIGGCYRVGVSRAERTVQDCIENHGFSDGHMWKLVCAAYEESQERDGCPYVNLDPVDVALENYNLVRLRQNRWEKHEYKGLFVKEKDTPAGEAKKPPEEGKIPLEAGSDDNRGFGQEESSV